MLRGASHAGASGRSRLLVYTVSTSGYDVDPSQEPRLARTATRGLDFVRFVDAESLARIGSRRKSVWQTVLLNSSDAPAVESAQAFGASSLGLAQRLSRDVKMRPHRYPLLWQYEASLYIDANVQPREALLPLFGRVVNGSTDLATYTFPRSLDDEAAWVHRYLTTRTSRFNSSKSREWLDRTLASQLTRYKRHGDHLWNQTAYGKVILRRHSYRTVAFGELWWAEFTRGVPRDQLSFRFCARQTGRRHGLRTATLGWRGRWGPRFRRYFQVVFGRQKGRLAGF